MIKSRPSSLLSRSFQNARFFIVFLFSILMWQCVSPPDFLGGELIPHQDIFRVKTDTSFKISAYTVKYDSLITARFTEAIVGETYDEVFGRSRSSFLTQLFIPTVGHKFGSNPSIDSAYLYLHQSAKLGNEPVLFSVYELAVPISPDSAYSGLQSINNWIETAEIDSTNEAYRGEKNLLKIRIKDSWIHSKLISPSETHDSIMMSQENFLKHLNGIYVTPKNSFANPAKGMYYFNYLHPESRLIIYYRNDELDEEAETLSYSYVFSQENARFNHFQNDTDAASSDLKVKFNNPEDTQNNLFYVKGLGVARGILKFDDIVSWLDSMPIAINRAELRIELEEDNNLPKDSLLNNLYLYIEKDKKRENLLDYLVSDENFGGNYSKSKKYYSFNITYHIQSLLNDPSKETMIFIEPKFASQRANGAVLRSGIHEKPIKLIITYTKF